MQNLGGENSRDNGVKLTIAIPTRNRCESLKKVVTEACERVRAEDAVNDVCILVVDDCSSADNTEAYIKELIKEYGFLSYYRCGENLGFDRKLLKCLELARSKYVWTINDHSSILPGVIRKLLECLREDYWYIFAPNKGGLGLAGEVYSLSKKGLGFVNGVINANIFNRERLIPYYKKHLPEYDGSWLVFQMANLDMLYENMCTDVLLLQFECTEYGKHMDSERKKNTWSANWGSYVKTGYYAAKLLLEIKKKYAISNALYENIFNRRGWGMGSCWTYISLRQKGRKIEKERAEMIVSHPTYNFIEKAIIMGVLTADQKWLVIYKAMLYLYTGYLIPSHYRRIFKGLWRRLRLVH